VEYPARVKVCASQNGVGMLSNMYVVNSLMCNGNPAESQTPLHWKLIGHSKVITQQDSPATFIKVSFPQVIFQRVFKTLVL